MSRNSLTVLAVLAFAAIVLLANTLYIVGQTEQVVVVRLGDPVREVNRPGTDESGLQAKIPFVENLVRFDKRNLAMERQKEEITSSNQEKMVVDAFVRYRITDPLQFYKTAHNEEGGEALLQRLVNSALREALGTAKTDEIISSKRDVLMRQVRDDVARRVALSKFGVTIIDLRIKRADLPEANEEAVYKRMQTQRQQEAQQVRAEGQQQAQEVLGAASKEAETTRGEADAERAQIFAQSYGKDPSFAAFYRSMRAYENSMANNETTMVLSPDSDFFKYFKAGPGTGK
jgi:membrane protease subunit HflC